MKFLTQSSTVPGTMCWWTGDISRHSCIQTWLFLPGVSEREVFDPGRDEHLVTSAPEERLGGYENKVMHIMCVNA
jgi:hypothetical protein